MFPYFIDLDSFQRNMRPNIYIIGLCALIQLGACQSKTSDPTPDDKPEFYFGADLSYVNQVVDHGGVYRDKGEVKSPYKIFKSYGTKLVRLRLWHNPVWTKEVYGSTGTQLYNDLKDVEKSIALAKAEGLKMLLDFHYSDIWADPGTQKIPAAWKNITSIQVLKDSVYNYTYRTLSYFQSKGLLPEFIQVGNETNCGMLYTEALSGFPNCNGCNGQWSNLRAVINSGIKAAREVASKAGKEIKIILHVADPKNVEWWFDNVTAGGEISDFDIIGISYYPIWHTTVSVPQLSEKVSWFKTKFKKDIMVLETAYPWTSTGNDGYNNIFGSQAPISGYPFTPQGQLEIMKAITQEIITGGGIGIVYWEPAWISSGMKDLWGAGSSWENNTFFDFNGNVNTGIEFMKHSYTY
jgi:arabinogalactan endo-1,4-beta-galactosidase